MTIEIAKFVLQSAIAVVSAFLAAWLAARRFRTDRWWEKKAAAYSELIEALHDMKWAAKEHYMASLLMRDVPREESDKMWAAYKAARRNAWRIAESSAFVVSVKVLESVERLEQALQDADTETNWQDHLDEIICSVRKCLQEVKDIGRAELHL